MSNYNDKPIGIKGTEGNPTFPNVVPPGAENISPSASLPPSSEPSSSETPPSSGNTSPTPSTDDDSSSSSTDEPSTHDNS